MIRLCIFDLKHTIKCARIPMVNEDFKKAQEYLYKEGIKDAGIFHKQVSPFRQLYYTDKNWEFTRTKELLYNNNCSMYFYENDIDYIIEKGSDYIKKLIDTSGYKPNEIAKLSGDIGVLKEAKRQGLWTIGVLSYSPYVNKKPMSVITDMLEKNTDETIYNFSEIDIAIKSINGKILVK